MSAPDRSRLAPLLESLAAGGKPTAKQLASLSDLDREELEVVREGWPSLAEQAKRALLVKLTELAEEDVELDFDAVALMALDDESPAVREAAIDALWESEDRRVARRLAGMMVDDLDESVRARAAGSLGGFVLLREFEALNREDGDRLVHQLRAKVEDAAEALPVRAKALEALGARSLPWVSDLIAEHYENDSRIMRLAAVRTMGFSADEDWLEYLYEQLHSDDPEFRFEAVRACGHIGAEDALDEVSALIDDEDGQVAGAAIDALGEIGGPRARAILEAAREGVPPELSERLEEAIELASVALGLGLSDEEGEDEEW